MRRYAFLTVLTLAASTAAYAEEKPAAASNVASAAAPAKAKPRNAFSQALADLARAAREQHDAEAKSNSAVTSQPDSTSGVHAAPADAPVLADSNGR